MLLTILSFVTLLLLLFLIIGWYNNNYWKKRGVVFYNGNVLNSILYDFFTGKKPFFIHLHDIYKKYPNDPAVAVGLFSIPVLYVRDPTNIQYILSSEFNSFNHRGIETNESDVLAKNTLFQNGKTWKLLRENMTPLFTSSKLKNMFYIMDKSAQDFVKYLKNDRELRQYNTYQKISMFCCAAICGTVFGIGTNSIFDLPFLKIAQKSLKSTLKINMRFALSTLSKTLFNKFKIHFFKEYEDFFIEAIKQVIHQREQDNIKKHDFVDIWLALHKSGKLKDPDNGFELETTNELLAAQAFSFFLAGVEPTATAMFATLFELAKHPDIQQNIHAEIDSVFENHNGSLTYEIISEMVYLDMAIKEAMRLHPSIATLSRRCVQNTVLPTGNIVVEKGTKIFIPVYELHHDEKYFPDPEAYIPERFSRENKHEILEFTYLPFGKGNRTCIGMQYAHMQIKTGLVHMLRHFTVHTDIHQGKQKYLKHLIQLRLDHIDIKFLRR